MHSLAVLEARSQKSKWYTGKAPSFLFQFPVVSGLPRLRSSVPPVGLWFSPVPLYDLSSSYQDTNFGFGPHPNPVGPHFHLTKCICERSILQQGHVLRFWVDRNLLTLIPHSRSNVLTLFCRADHLGPLPGSSVSWHKNEVPFWLSPLDAFYQTSVAKYPRTDSTVSQMETSTHCIYNFPGGLNKSIWKTSMPCSYLPLCTPAPCTAPGT